MIGYHACPRCGRQVFMSYNDMLAHELDDRAIAILLLVLTQGQSVPHTG